jgi:hypothetical protein
MLGVLNPQLHVRAWKTTAVEQMLRLVPRSTVVEGEPDAAIPAASGVFGRTQREPNQIICNAQTSSVGALVSECDGAKRTALIKKVAALGKSRTFRNVGRVQSKKHTREVWRERNRLTARARCARTADGRNRSSESRSERSRRGRRWCSFSATVTSCVARHLATETFVDEVGREVSPTPLLCAKQAANQCERVCSRVITHASMTCHRHRC